MQVTIDIWRWLLTGAPPRSIADDLYRLATMADRVLRYGDAQRQQIRGEWGLAMRHRQVLDVNEAHHSADRCNYQDRGGRRSPDHAAGGHDHISLSLGNIGGTLRRGPTSGG